MGTRASDELNHCSMEWWWAERENPSVRPDQDSKPQRVAPTYLAFVEQPYLRQGRSPSQLLQMVRNLLRPTLLRQGCLMILSKWASNLLRMRTESCIPNSFRETILTVLKTLCNIQRRVHLNWDTASPDPQLPNPLVTNLGRAE